MGQTALAAVPPSDQIAGVLPAPAESRSLFRMAAWCAAAAVLLGVVQASIEAYGVAVLQLPVPSSTEGWLILLHEQRVFAVTAFTVLQIPMFVLAVPVLVALDRALDGARNGAVRVAAAIGIVGVTVYLANQTTAAVVDLSDRYAVTSDSLVRGRLVTAAESLIALYQGPGLSTGALLLILSVGVLSSVMRRSRDFAGVPALLGIASAVFGLGYYVAVPFPERIYLLEVSGALFAIWLAFIARRLLVLSR